MRRRPPARCTTPPAPGSGCPTIAKRRKRPPRPPFLRALAALFCSSLVPGVSAAPPAPRRVVALAPNLTEIVFALGAGDRLVGVSDFSDYPAAARSLPSIGGVNPDLERIAVLSPDLILATSEGNSPRTVSLLEKKGYPVLATRATSLEGVLESILEIARRLGIPGRGEALVETLRRREAAVESRRASGARPGVLVLVWPSPAQAAGRGTFADDLIERAGGENCIPRSGWPV